MLKKLSLLALAVGALMAFAVPAAQADEWYTHTGSGDVKIGGPTGEEFEFTGFLSSTAAGGAVESGPCEVHALVDLWNENGTGTGEVTNFEITTPCPVTSPFPIIPPECFLENATSKNFPWHVTVLPETGVAIGDEERPANFKNFYSGCAPTLPAEAEAAGVATGQVVNGEGESCIVFENSGHLEGELGPVTIDGSVCTAGLTLK